MTTNILHGFSAAIQKATGEKMLVLTFWIHKRNNKPKHHRKTTTTITTSLQHHNTNTTTTTTTTTTTITNHYHDKNTATRMKANSKIFPCALIPLRLHFSGVSQWLLLGESRRWENGNHVQCVRGSWLSRNISFDVFFFLKLMVGRRSFPFGTRPIFRALLVLGSVFETTT